MSRIKELRASLDKKLDVLEHRALALFERLGGIIEMGQRVPKGTPPNIQATYEGIKHKIVAKQK